MKKIVIAGNPIEHSLSPEMQNAAFKHLDLDFVYERMKVTDLDSFIEKIKTREIFGANITIPHKIEVCRLMDRLTPEAERIGAVNTIYFEDGKLIGENTDGAGARQALFELTDLKGKKVAIIGAGGAARAVALSLPECEVTIYNRSAKNALILGRLVRTDPGPLDDPRIKEADIIVNCTPKGLASDPKSPIEPELINAKIVMDIVYTPRMTEFLKSAKAKGCTIIDGTGMLLYQGALSFKYWTGTPAPVEIMRTALLKAIEKRG